VTITDVEISSRVRIIADLGANVAMPRFAILVDGIAAASVVGQVLGDPEVEPTSADGAAILLWRSGAGLYPQSPSATIFRDHYAQQVRLERFSYENPVDAILAVVGGVGGASGLVSLLQFLNTRRSSRVEASARADKTRAEAELVRAEARKVHAEATKIDIELLTALSEFLSSETGKTWTPDHVQVFLGPRETRSLKALEQTLRDVEPI
jgi:hypothetical protein